MACELNPKLEFNDLVPWKGPICDPIGFSQHSGECWMDTILESFLFSDSTKGITQKTLYTLDDNVINQLVHTNLTNLEHFLTRDTALTQANIFTILQFIKNVTRKMSIRFKNHYNKIFLVKKTCINTNNGRRCYRALAERDMTLDPVMKGSTTSAYTGVNSITNYNVSKLKLIRSKSMNLGPTIARNLLGVSNIIRNATGASEFNFSEFRSSSSSGANTYAIILTTIFLLSLFNIDLKITELTPAEPFGGIAGLPLVISGRYSGTNNNYMISNSSILNFKGRATFIRNVKLLNVEKITIEAESGHATSMFSCKHQWYFYDDNVGMNYLPYNMYNQIKQALFYLVKNNDALLKLPEYELIHNHILLRSRMSDNNIYAVSLVRGIFSNTLVLVAHTFNKVLGTWETGTRVFGDYEITIRYVFNIGTNEWESIDTVSNSSAFPTDDYMIHTFDSILIIANDAPMITNAPLFTPKKTLWNRIRGRGRKNNRRTKKHKRI